MPEIQEQEIDEQEVMSLFADVLSTCLADITSGLQKLGTYPMETEAMKMLNEVLTTAIEPQSLLELAKVKRPALVRAMRVVRDLFEDRGWDWETMEVRLPN